MGDGGPLEENLVLRVRSHNSWQDSQSTWHSTD